MKQLFLLIIGICSSLFAIIENSEPLNWNDPKWAWMDEQIERDFFAFTTPGELNFLPFEPWHKKEGITTHMLNCVMHNRHLLSFGEAINRFQIIGKEIYGPEGEAKSFLKKIVSLYPVPDVDIIIQSQDIIFTHWHLQGPVLVTCKTGGVMQIFFPSQLWETWEYFAPLVEKASLSSPWESKNEKYFWRGKPNDADNYRDLGMWTQWRRGKLCYLSQQYPELVDAAFNGSYHTHSIASNQVEEFFAFFPPKEASWEEYVSYKYLLDLDGYVASTPGFAWKLQTGCAIFKHDSPYRLYFYGAIKPWEHYIPFNQDLSDLFEKLQWAKGHDEEVRKIANNSRQFAKENLMPEHVYLYCFKVLSKYASLQKFAPTANGVYAPALPPPSKSEK